MTISDRRSLRVSPRSWVFAAICAAAAAQPTFAHDELPAHHKVLPSTATAVMKAFWLDQHSKQALDAVTGEAAAALNACSGGAAGVYACNEIDLQSFLPLNDIGGTASNSAGNDIWGWASPGGKEYALMGRVFGTSVVDVTDPVNPVYLGDLPTHGAFGSSWRDIKVYEDQVNDPPQFAYAYVVSEALNHGMQVLDLMQLDAMDRAAPPVTFAETAHYNSAAASHNLNINEQSGFAYMVGNSGKNSCSGGLHMVDLSDPANPSFAGCFASDGYTHDVQCVIYQGPDATYAGAEICFAANEDTLTIVDVTDKSNPVQLSRTGYGGSAYTHQGWLTEDHAYFLVDDELDEQSFGHNTRTRVFDVSDLTAPSLVNTHDGATPSIDHNLYTLGTCAIEANYRSGLRIVNFADGYDLPGAEEAFFDIYPADDAAQFNGMWSNYPYLPSGNIVASGIEQGLYVLKPSAAVAAACNFPDPPNSAPVVSISSPADGASFVEGATIGFAGSALDGEDGALAIDTWSSSLQGPIGSGASFSTSALIVGLHEVTATSVADSGGLTGSAVVTVIVTPVGGATEMFVQALDGAVIAQTSRRYTGQVLITVRDNAAANVEGATVSGAWSGAAKGTGSCATNTVGQCSVSKSGKIGQDMIFTVSDVTHGSLTYTPGANLESSETIPSP